MSNHLSHVFNLFNLNIMFTTNHMPSKLNIDSIYPIERFRQRLSVSENIIYYSLTRVEVLRLAGQFIAERKYSCPYIQEYQVEAVFCAAGMVKVIPCIFWLRNLDVPPISFKGWDRSILADNWLCDVSNASEIIRLSKSADYFLAKSSGHDEKITGKEFLFEVKQSRRIQGNSRASVSIVDGMYLVSRNVYESLPVCLREFVRKVRLQIRNGPPKGFKSIPHMIAELSGAMSVDENDLTRVKKLVESRFH
jgi:hypothetical protein